MALAYPRLYVAAERFSKLPHLLCLYLRNTVSPLVIRDIPLLAEHVELPDDGRLDAEGELQRVNHAVMMVCTFRFVTSGG